MSDSIPETPVIDPWKPDGQERKETTGTGKEAWAAAIILLSLAAICAASVAAAVLFTTAEDSAGSDAVRRTIKANQNDIAAQLVLRSLDKAEVSPERAEQYAKAAQGTDLTTGRCREESASRYTATYSCRLELHLSSPHQLTVTGEYWTLVERKKGINYGLFTFSTQAERKHAT